MQSFKINSRVWWSGYGTITYGMIEKIEGDRMFIRLPGGALIPAEKIGGKWTMGSLEVRLCNK